MAEEKKQKNKIPSGLPKGKMPKSKFNFYWVYGIVAVIFIGLTFTNWGSGAVKETDWGDLKGMLSSGDVEKIVVVNQEEAEIYIKKDKLNESRYEDITDKDGYGAATPHYMYNIGSYDTFKEDVERAQEGLQILFISVTKNVTIGQVKSLAGFYH